MHTAYAISCRSCGGPRTLSEEAPCAYCRAPAETDPDVRRRLATHAMSVLRAGHKARSSIVYRWRLAQAVRSRWLLLGGLLVSLVGGLASLIGAGVAAETAESALVRTVGPGCACFGLFALVPALLLGVTSVHRHRMRRAARVADARLEGMDPSADTSCGRCGAHSRVVGNGPWTCPYCRVPLVAPPAATRSIAEQLHALSSRETDATRRQFFEFVRQRELQPIDVGIPGLAWSGGVVEGVIEGAQVWGGEDVLGSRAVQRLEVSMSTGRDDTIWLVHRAHEADHRALAERLGVPVPAQPAHELGAGWRLYGSEADARALGWLAGRLEPRESLWLDPGGASWWKIDARLQALFARWQNLGRIVPLLVPAALGRIGTGSPS